MAKEEKDPVMAALEAVHSALKDLTPDQRIRVLSSVNALLGTSPVPLSSLGGRLESTQRQPPQARAAGLTEIARDKNAKTNPELITLFAYYREKYENSPKFNRDDLLQYFEKAHEPRPRNYSRDFVVAIRNGWIHEDGDNSYITSKGIETVEAGFAGEKPKEARRKTKPRATKNKRR